MSSSGEFSAWRRDTRDRLACLLIVLLYRSSCVAVYCLLPVNFPSAWGRRVDCGRRLMKVRRRLSSGLVIRRWSVHWPRADNIDGGCPSSSRMARDVAILPPCKFVFPLGRRLFDHATPRLVRRHRRRRVPGPNATAYRRPADGRRGRAGPSRAGPGGAA